MKTFSKTLFFAALGGIAGLALSQAVPYPFNIVTSGTVTAQGLDAGSAAVQGALTVGGVSSLANTRVTGTMTADGGFFQKITDEGNIVLDTPTGSPSGIALCLDNTCTATVAENNSGYVNLTGTWVRVNSGTGLTNIGVGSCSLSSGQCNAQVAGAQGGSLCVASVQGTSQTLVGCDVRADAGSATAFCNASATGTAAIVCFN